VNGLWGVMGLPERVRTLGRDNQGRLRQQYSVTFEAEPFAQKVLRKIHESDYHKAKFQRGDLKQAEAFFYIKAVNAYNNLSDTETVSITVNLVAQAGEARFEGEPQVQSLNVGRELTHFFNIRSRGDRGEVSVQSVSLDDTALELKDGAYAFSQDS